MKIIINGKERNTTGIESLLWGIVAMAITSGTFLFVGAILLGMALMFTSPIWVPILLIKLFIK